MTNAFLITDDDIIICDPEAEYFSLVQRLGGQVIRLSPAGKGMDGKPQYVNPMDINLNYSEDDNPLALKSDFILSLCELVIGGKEGLQPVEKTVIDRAVRNVYRPFLADPDPAENADFGRPLQRTAETAGAGSCPHCGGIGALCFRLSERL